ncbi:MAG: hypothetical protein LBS34_00610, partial [Rickettsiales bacterium]|nr:hypothetical protein [Rickettsiales bacterium]
MKQMSRKYYEKVVERVKYFIDNFYPWIFGMIFMLFAFEGYVMYKYNFHTDKISNIVKEAKYAGNAVILNKNFILTSYNTINDVCRMTENTQKQMIFVVFNDGNTYEVLLHGFDPKLNLALLVFNRHGQSKVNLNNYVIFPKIAENMVGKNVFVSKTKNSFLSFYKKFKIDGISDSGYYIKNKDNIKNNKGEAVLNDKFEFVGITTGNTKRNRSKFLLNEVNIISQYNVISFLWKNGILYHRNVE